MGMLTSCIDYQGLSVRVTPHAQRTTKQHKEQGETNKPGPV